MMIALGDRCERNHGLKSADVRLPSAMIGRVVVFVVGLWATCTHGAESPEDLPILHIGSLEEVQGDWTIAPEGVAMFAGDFLTIKGGRCRYRQFTDAGSPPLKEPIECDVALVHGYLLLKTDNPHVPAKKWYLTKVGEHKCLVFLTARGESPIVANAEIRYHRPSSGTVKPDDETFKKRLVPRSTPSRKSSAY